LDPAERGILEALDLAVRSEAIRPKLDAIAARVSRRLRANPGEPLAWEPVPLDLYEATLPGDIRSSWVFVLRANTTTGAERHPNSHQRMMSYRGRGDFQTCRDDAWRSHFLTSDPAAPLAERWISIPVNVWHQGVVPGDDWVVVSFHTVPEHELIEERPAIDATDAVRRRRYADRAAP
jgi:hypothetical protein